jgi:hypothetical protein
MLLTKDRIILTANRYAQDLGARIGKHCGRVFGMLISRLNGPDFPDYFEEGIELSD